MNDHFAEALLVGLLAALAGLVALIWDGAQLAALVFGCHHLMPVNGQATVLAVAGLLGAPGHPAAAWGPGGSCLPGPIPYWAATLLAAVTLLSCVAVVTVAVLSGRRVGLVRRRRLGVDPDGRIATGLDLLPLWVQGPVAGRILLGWVGPRRPALIPPAPLPGASPVPWWRRVVEVLRRLLGGRLVATENPGAPMDPAIPRVLHPIAARRRGGRGSVIVLGPSQCGKTSALAIPAILEWAGPVIALSVKNDLLGATIRRRRQVGQVRVFDPAQVTGEPGDTWSPVRQAATLAGARRAARSIANATAWTHQAGDLGFWTDAGEDLLACLLWTAATAGLGIDAAVRWVLSMDQKAVKTFLASFAVHDDPVVAREGQQVLEAFTAVWASDPKQISSIYLTARQMIRPWQEPSVQASATGEHSIDLDWLLSTSPANPTAPPDQAGAPDDVEPDDLTSGGADGGEGVAGANTVYLCADLDEAERLAPVLGGLLDDLLRQAYARAGTNGALDPPLLVVIDEAGNWPLRSLPSRISTCAGLGIQLLLIYQSKAQIDAAYDRKADIVLANATTKIAFAGLSDESSLRYASYLLGDEHVTSTSTSTDLTNPLTGGSGRSSLSRQPTRVDLLPPSLLRQVRPGQALLVHHTLRPAHLHGRYWYLEPDLYLLATGQRRTRRQLARAARQPAATPTPQLTGQPGPTMTVSSTRPASAVAATSIHAMAAGKHAVAATEHAVAAQEHAVAAREDGTGRPAVGARWQRRPSESDRR